MRTDVVLDSVKLGQRIIIDAKFTSILTSGWYREETLRSAYIYQIYAYLRSQVGRGDPYADCASGLLLHPSIGTMVDETVAIQGHNIRFFTIDLTGSANESDRSYLIALGSNWGHATPCLPQLNPDVLRCKTVPRSTHDYFDSATMQRLALRLRNAIELLKRVAALGAMRRMRRLRVPFGVRSFVLNGGQLARHSE